MKKAVAALALVCAGACGGGATGSGPTTTGDGAGASVSSTAPPVTPPPSIVVYDGPEAPDAPGELVAAEAASGPDDRALRIRYLSTGVRGGLVEVSGAVYVPEGEPPPGGWPVVGWAHGTAGGADACAPSLAAQFDLSIASFEPLLDQGFVVAATDYEGLGTPGPHPVLNGLSEARSVVDAVRAARQLVPGASEQWVTVGHSQGGHAAMFTAEEGPRYAPELDLLGAVAYAPPSGLAAFTDADATPRAALLALVLAGYVASSAVDPATLLTEAGIEALDVVERVCVFDVFSTVRDDRLLQRDAADPDPALAAYLAANDIGQGPTDVPMLVLQGGADDMVPDVLTASTVARMCGLGDTIELVRYPDANHSSIFIAADERATTWLVDRVEGRPARSTC